MLEERADEAQALLHPPVRVETGRIRNGVVERAEIIEIPEEFFSTVTNTVLEQLHLAKHTVLRDYPRLAANSIVDQMVHDGVLSASASTRVRDKVELEIRRGIERIADDARERFTTRLPFTLRSLIPLITRRSGKPS